LSRGYGDGRLAGCDVSRAWVLAACSGRQWRSTTSPSSAMRISPAKAQRRLRGSGHGRCRVHQRQPSGTPDLAGRPHGRPAV